MASFPSNVRLVRASPNYNETANFASPSGFVFAKRKKKPFRGPVLAIGPSNGSSPASRLKEPSASVSRSTSVHGRASGEIIEEENEDDIEEVDAFSPVPPEAEETLWEVGKESESDGWVKRRHE